MRDNRISKNMLIAIIGFILTSFGGVTTYHFINSAEKTEKVQGNDLFKTSANTIEKNSVTLTSEPIFNNTPFEDPTAFIQIGEKNEFLISDRKGRIFKFTSEEKDSPELETVLDITGQTARIQDGGILNFVTHPSFSDKHSEHYLEIFVLYTFRKPGSNPSFSINNVGMPGIFNGAYLRLSSFRLDPKIPLESRLNNEKVMIQHRLYNDRNRGGGLAFGNDDFLYVGIGDQDRFITSQKIGNNLEGGILRIDVNKKGGNISHPPKRKMGVHAGNEDEFSGNYYYIPSDNPWQSENSAVFEEYFAIGLRNPNVITVNEQAGELYAMESTDSPGMEINRIERGGNYGWPLFAGDEMRYDRNQVVDQLPKMLGKLQTPLLFNRTEKEDIFILGCFTKAFTYSEASDNILFSNYRTGEVFSFNTENYSQSLLTVIPGGKIAGYQMNSLGDIFFFKGTQKYNFNSLIYTMRPALAIARQEEAEAPSPSPSLENEEIFSETENTYTPNESSEEHLELVSTDYESALLNEGHLIQPFKIFSRENSKSNKKFWGNVHHLIDGSGFSSGVPVIGENPADHFKRSIWYTTSIDLKTSSTSLFIDLGSVEKISHLLLWLQDEYQEISSPQSVSLYYLEENGDISEQRFAEAIFSNNWKQVLHKEKITTDENNKISHILEAEAKTRYIKLVLFVEGSSRQIGLNELAFLSMPTTLKGL